jgi:hypothetical protein
VVKIVPIKAWPLNLKKSRPIQRAASSLLVAEDHNLSDKLHCFWKSWLSGPHVKVMTALVNSPDVDQHRPRFNSIQVNSKKPFLFSDKSLM